jgi:hypothetical protein
VGGVCANRAILPAVWDIAVLSLILFLFILWIVLCLCLAAWTVWFQNYVYLEVASGVFWRAPAVATILMVYVCCWCVLGYRAVRADPKSANPYVITINFNPARDQVYPVLWTVAYKTRGAGDGQGEEGLVRTRYELVKSGNGPQQYRKDGQVHGPELPARPDEIIVAEADAEGNPQEVSFKPDRDANGNFKVEEVKGFFTPATKQPLQYRDGRNRVMAEGNLGAIAPPARTGQVIVNCILYALHLVIWFLCVWLLLRFQAGHSVLIALGCWLVMTFCVVGPMFDRAEKVARSQPVVQAVAPPAP